LQPAINSTVPTGRRRLRNYFTFIVSKFSEDESLRKSA
jgi:hypothetical protein